MPLGPCWFQPTTTWEHILWIGYPRAPGSGSPPPEQPVQVSEAPTTDQAPSTPVEVPTDSRQDDGQGKKVEAPQGKEKNQDKGKGQASDTAVSQSKQVADPEAPKAKA